MLVAAKAERGETAQETGEMKERSLQEMRRPIATSSGSGNRQSESVKLPTPNQRSNDSEMPRSEITHSRHA